MYEFEPAGIRIDIFDGVEIYLNAYNEQDYGPPETFEGKVDGHLVNMSHPPIRLWLATGPKATVEELRKPGERGERVEQQPEQVVSVCGKQAIRLESRRIVNRESLAPQGGRLTRKDRTQVVLAFEHRGKPVAVMWSVKDTSEREAYLEAEAHFFDSLQCL